LPRSFEATMSSIPATERSNLLAEEGDGKDYERREPQNKEKLCKFLGIGLACFLLLSMLICAIHDEPSLPTNTATTTITTSGKNIDGQKNNGLSTASTSDGTNHTFPSSFLFGSATSSYQVEGATHEDGRGMTIWDTFCYEGGHVLKNESADVACDHYHRYRDDVKLMKSLNLQAYRLSIAWTRILPNGYGGNVNQAGIKFYNRLIDTLIEHNIEPWITLYHWDLPQQLEDDVGGWLDHSGNSVVVDAFGEYARICFREFGDRVKHWITLNEPWTVAVHGYNDGVKAPGRSQMGATETYIAAHNQLLAHGKAASIYKHEFAREQKGKIGMSNSADFRYPLTDSKDDRDAAERAMLFQFGWFMEPVIRGDYPDVMRKRLGDRLPKFTKDQRYQLLGSCDFFGINTYSSALASKPDSESVWSGYWQDMFVTTSVDPSWDKNFMGWPTVPDATRELLLWISKRYNYPLLYITENGTAEDEEDVKTAQQDEGRRRFFEGHLRACAAAIEAGVHLAGYFAWSFMDNFEWEYGYQRRFGICFVDFETQQRTPKRSALWYSKVIATGGQNIAR